MATSKAKSAKAPEEAVPYNELRAQLDEVLTKLQDPDCDVDEAVGLYEQAMVLADRMELRLEAAENRVQAIQADLTRDANTGNDA